MLRLIVYPVKLMKSFNFTTFIHHLLYLKLFVDLRLYLVEVDEVGDVALPELVERPHVVVRDPLPRQPVQSHRPPLPRGEVLRKGSRAVAKPPYSVRPRSLPSPMAGDAPSANSPAPLETKVKCHGTIEILSKHLNQSQ